jgi:transcription elongation factor Elf1
MEEITSVINGIKSKFVCENCNHEQIVNVFPCINFNQNPEYYALVKNLDVFKIKCEKCKNEILIKYDALYLNEDRKYFVYLLTNKTLVQKFRNQIRYFLETMLNKDDKYNFDEFKTRLVFDVNSLIEKLAIFELGLNDLVIEVIKYGFYENEVFDTNEFDSVYFDGIKETNLEFVLLSNNDKTKIDKIFINIEYYNKFVDTIAKLHDDSSEIFANIDYEWVKTKIDNINK